MRDRFISVQEINDGEERRQALSEKYVNNLRVPGVVEIFMIFEFQAVLEMIIGLPLLIVSFNPDPGLSCIEILGVVIFAVALIGEGIADQQLFAFKNNVMNKGKTCDAGLNGGSQRHPNYFLNVMDLGGVLYLCFRQSYGTDLPSSAPS